MPRPYCGYAGPSNSCEYCFSETAVYLRDCFRLLWEQHVYWTRMVINSIAFDLPDSKPVTDRLLRNPSDFARLLNRFYPNEAASKFSSLLTDHLVIAAELVKAAKAGNSSAAADAEKRWYKNADEISRLLSQINPYWSYTHMRDMWFKHLALTKAEAVAILSKDYPRSIEIFSQIEQLAMTMADTFSNGITRQISH